MFITYDYRACSIVEAYIISINCWDFRGYNRYRDKDWHMGPTGLRKLPSESCWIIPGTIDPRD
jgi:hypothetical protein